MIRNDTDYNMMESIINLLSRLRTITSFKDNVLSLLSDVISFDEGIFFTVNRQGVVTCKTGYEIDNLVLNKWASFASSEDPLLVQKYMYASMNHPIMLSTNNSTDRAKHLRFLNFMENDGYCCGLLYSLNSLGDGIRLFRRKDKEVFSAEEMELFCYVCGVLQIIYDNVNGIQELRREVTLFRESQNSMYFGYVIFDENFVLLQANDKAAQRISKITGKINFNEMIQDFVEIVKDIFENGVLVEADVSRYQVFESYIVEVTVRRIIDDNGNISNFYFIIIYGKSWFASVLHSSVAGIIDHTDITVREKDITNLLIQCKSTADIAHNLFISEHTVKEHIKNIFKKLNVKNRSELIVKIYEQTK